MLKIGSIDVGFFLPDLAIDLYPDNYPPTPTCALRSL